MRIEVHGDDCYIVISDLPQEEGDLFNVTVPIDTNVDTLNIAYTTKFPHLPASVLRAVRLLQGILERWPV